MRVYKNLGGNSSVWLYNIRAKSITVGFSDGSIYIYTRESVGASRLKAMKRRATKGVGLNSYINRKVPKLYYYKSYVNL